MGKLRNKTFTEGGVNQLTGGGGDIRSDSRLISARNRQGERPTVYKMGLAEERKKRGGCILRKGGRYLS